MNSEITVLLTILLSEPVMAVLGVVACVVLFSVLAIALALACGEQGVFLAGLLCAFPTIYFLVRFIKWAWETPIPFRAG